MGFQCRNGQCVCRDKCPPKHSNEPDVCGTDGKLYPSECELKRQSCIQQTNIDVDLTGVKCRHNNPSLLQDSNGKMSGNIQAVLQALGHSMYGVVVTLSNAILSHKLGLIQNIQHKGKVSSIFLS
ncbi:unnamed protein product [Trichobilharzia regenti]|nr:unnamed protein product [Trichobilharzia regenti]